MLSVCPLYLPDITTAAENGAFQNPSTFYADVRNSTAH
jgi:hypothetical protein